MRRFLLFLIIVFAIILRLFKLGMNPPSLTWDEASLGYNAYTIAASGRDEHGEFLPLARFIAFGDYKPPGYIYAAVPSIWFFGLNEFSVRLPSMAAGVLIIVITYLLVKELFKKEVLALLSALFTAVSPWAIHFSRAAFEANLAAFFNLLGIYFFALSKRKKWMILLSFIFFILSFYTFNANRIIAPLLLIGLSILYFKDLIGNFRWFIVSILVSLILIFPSISYLRSRESRLRFQEVSIFNNLEIIKLSNQRISLDDNSLLARIIHNRRILFASDFLKHYFDNFKLRFLFTHGDVNPRLAVQNMGQLYVWDLPFLILGTYWLIKKKEKGLLTLILWILIVPIPAGMAKETPHALRILSILPTYQIIIGYGLYQIVGIIKKKFVSKPSTSGESSCDDHPRGDFDAYCSTPSRSRFATPGRWQNGLLPGGLKKIIAAVLCFLLSANMFYYLHDYYFHFPRDWSGEWQYGYKEMVSYVSQNEDKYDQIFVTNAQGRPYIFFAFYQEMPFEKFYQSRVAVRDWFGFWNVEALGKVRFNFDRLSSAEGRILLVTTPGNIPSDYRLLTTVYNLAKDEVFVIVEKNET